MKKKYKHGFVFGKFMPVHNGHLHMIHTAEANCEELTILVCSLKSEPISGVARFMWMRELMPDAIVKHITDEVPQYPHEHPDFWEIWTKLLLDNIDPNTDVVFTSENYGFEVAERLGIKHELVDIDRKTVPVSGTAIRKDPFKNWSYIPDCVKPYFSKKIVFVGNECTGKTTMSKQIAKYFNDRFNNSQWIGEYGREYCESMQKPILDEGDFKNIAWGQLHTINEGVSLGKKLNFIDTDLTVTESYARTYLGYCPELIIGLNSIMKYDLHILMDIDLPWEQDNTRIYIKPEQRQEHFNAMKETLDYYKCNYVVVSGTGDVRFHNAVAAIESFLSEATYSMLNELRVRVYKLMDEDKKGFFHSYRGDGYLPLSMREVIENIAHEFDGKIFYHSYAKNSLRMTYVFNDKFTNYLFRNELINHRIAYMTTGYTESTHLIFDL